MDLRFAGIVPVDEEHPLGERQYKVIVEDKDTGWIRELTDSEIEVWSWPESVIQVFSHIKFPNIFFAQVKTAILNREKALGIRYNDGNGAITDSKKKKEK